MEDIYIPNEYKIDNKGIQYDDLLDLIDAFIKGEINLWLKRKGVSLNRDIDVLFILGHQCTGKSSLISKIACTYSLSNNVFNNIFILSFSDRDFKNNEFTIRSICSFLNVAVENLNDAIIILDGLDESEWSSTVVLDRLENLIIDLKEYNCKLIISSRPKYFCTNDFKTSLDVYLQPFTLNQAKKWLDFYSLYDENCDKETIFNRLDSLSDDIKNIILIPYVFQICMMQDINFDTITELGKLYDIIFDKDRGKFLQTPYNSKERNTPSNRYSFIDTISKLSFRCIGSNENSIPVHIIDTLSNTYKEKITTEFLLYRKDQNNYAFIHESIPQYFVARSMVEKFEYYISADIWNEPEKLMKNIVDFTEVIPYTIFDYVEYFSRSNKRSIKLDAIKLLKLFLSNFMNIKMEFNSNLKEIQNYYYTKFVNITRLVFAFLKTSLLPFSKYEFFNALSKEELENFIFLTNLGNVPLDFMRICNYSNKSLNGINLKGVNFNGVFIKNTIIQKSNFDDANLTGAYLLNSDLSLSSFNNACCKIADFSNSILCGCSFVNAKLNGTNFSNAILDYADLRGAKINKCRFEGTSLKGVKILVEQLQNMLDFDLNYIKRKGVEVYADDCLIPYEVLEIEYRKIRPVGYAMNH